MRDVSVSILIILWSETVRPNYLHVSTCKYVKISIQMQINANINEKP